MTRIFFLGGGNMCAAMLAGLSANADFALHVVERSDERRAWLQAQYPVTTHEQLPDLQHDDVLILAVKPQDMQAALNGVAVNGALVLSIAAGLSCALLSQYLGGHRRIVRVMPNTPAQVQRGISGVYAGEVSDADKAAAHTIIRSVGEVLWVDDEEALHAVTAISGSGPGYVFYLMDALFQAALAQGFDEADARRLVLKTFQGASELAAQSEASFATLQHNVTSKGGTTFAALQEFSRAEVAHTVARAVQACAERSRAMGAEMAAKSCG
ncbi:MAG: pyrroline-5-carboxylate reductase [Neisseria sp.]|nr:pyrroline-5-carboxylate reductase [Neisseria sp.]